MGDPIAVNPLNRVGTKIAAEIIDFGDGVERRGARTVGRYMGTLIEDCEAGWTPEANVTATVEAAIKKVGAGSAKLAVAAGFTTGLAATRDFTAKDLSGFKYVGFWIYSDVAAAAGDIQILIDEHARCVSPGETLNVPALKAGVWRYVRLPFQAAGSAREATISVGIKLASDMGAQNIYVDDIRAGNEFLGVADDDQERDAYAPGPGKAPVVNIIDQGMVTVNLLGTGVSGQFLIPVGNGKFAVDGADTAESAGMKTVESVAKLEEDQGTADGQAPARLV